MRERKDIEREHLNIIKLGSAPGTANSRFDLMIEVLLDIRDTVQNHYLHDVAYHSGLIEESQKKEVPITS